jgi:preprotein translocase SecE subunit
MAIVKTTASGGNLPEKNSNKTTPVKAATPRTGGPQVRSGAPANSKTFVQDTIAELKRVVWPSREQVRAGTIVTIGLLIFFSLYIYGVDYVIASLFAALGLPT